MVSVVKPPYQRMRFALALVALSAALVSVAKTSATSAASPVTMTAPPFATVAQTEQLILHSHFGAINAITVVSCVGLLQPKPKQAAGQPTFHRFGCHLSGAYFDVNATVVLTGNGGFNVLPH
jgi:hypothetical protein